MVEGFSPCYFLGKEHIKCHCTLRSLAGVHFNFDRLGASSADYYNYINTKMWFVSKIRYTKSVITIKYLDFLLSDVVRCQLSYTSGIYSRKASSFNFLGQSGWLAWAVLRYNSINRSTGTSNRMTSRVWERIFLSRIPLVADPAGRPSTFRLSPLTARTLLCRKSLAYHVHWLGHLNYNHLSLR